jgi:hypothetical protein
LFIYITLKLAFQGIVDESNRLAREQEAVERSRWLRQALLQIETRYQAGEIDFETYSSMQDELLRTIGSSNPGLPGGHSAE